MNVKFRMYVHDRPVKFKSRLKHDHRHIYRNLTVLISLKHGTLKKLIARIRMNVTKIQITSGGLLQSCLPCT